MPGPPGYRLRQARDAPRTSAPAGKPYPAGFLAMPDHSPGQAGAWLWPELEDDVDRGLGDLPEPAEACVAGQLPYRCGAGLGAERDPAGLGQGGRRALERG